MTSFLLKSSPEFERALLNPSEPTDKLRQLMRDAVTLWNDTVREDVPDDFLGLLAKMK